MTDERRSLSEIADEQRLPVDALAFFVETCDHHSRRCMHAGRDEASHITADKFVRILRDYAIIKFGSAACETLESWGLSSSEDIGEIVDALVEDGWMQASESDSPSHFRDLGSIKELFQVG